MEINLKSKPFYLDDESIKWLNETKQSMSSEDKIGQLFFLLGMEDDEKYMNSIFDILKPGGVMYRPGAMKDINNAHKYWQSKSDVPMMFAANLEAGGNGMIKEGTSFGNNMTVAATNDVTNAYKLGEVCIKEAKAIGGNVAFAPVIDINYNFRNPITNTRSFGDDVEKIADMAVEYIKGIHSENGLVTIKHFPGDGCDSRDQHLITTTNNLSVSDWHKSYGYIYKRCIDADARGLMAGHINFPEYVKSRYMDDENKHMLPATLSACLLGDLLRGELGYNGLILTDATLMTGFGQWGKRKDLVPASIAAGCDMFLFAKDLKEDYQYMLDGYKNGIITEQRLDDAVTRILATKASMKLHENFEIPSIYKNIGSSESIEYAKDIADKAITLVKDTQSLLPLSNDKNKKIGLFYLSSDRFPSDTKQYFIDKMSEKGFSINLISHSDPKEMYKNLMVSVENLKKNYDLIIYLTNFKAQSNITELSIQFESFSGSDSPWFIDEIDTMLISLANPYHNHDLGMIKTMINAYSDSRYCIDAVVEKITGASEFKGVSPVKVDCKEFTGKI